MSFFEIASSMISIIADAKKFYAAIALYIAVLSWTTRRVYARNFARPEPIVAPPYF